MKGNEWNFLALLLKLLSLLLELFFFLVLCREDNTGSHERIISSTFSQIPPVWLCLTCQTWCPSMPQASYLIRWQKYLRHLKKHQRIGQIKSQVMGRPKLNFRVIWHLEAIQCTTKYPYQLSVAIHVILTSRCDSQESGSQGR